MWKAPPGGRPPPPPLPRPWNRHEGARHQRGQLGVFPRLLLTVCVASVWQCVAVFRSVLQHVLEYGSAHPVVPLLLSNVSVAVCCSKCAVCCSTWQCVAVCCSVLQCVAVCCSVLQCVAVWQCAVVHMESFLSLLFKRVCCSVLQFVAVFGSVWQCVAVCGRTYGVFSPL